MAKTLQQMKEAAAIIRNEVEDGRNSAQRIGSMFDSTIDFAVEESNKAMSLMLTEQLERGTLKGNGHLSWEQGAPNFWYGKVLLKADQLTCARVRVSGEGELRSLCFYLTKQQGTLDGGHDVIVEHINETFGEMVSIIFTPKTDGYLMVNTYSSASVTLDITASVTANSRLSDIEQQNAQIERRLTKVESGHVTAIDVQAMSLCSPTASKFPSLGAKFLDEYINMSGDSICAFNSSRLLAAEGVSRVPPVCDTQANAYFLWRACNWGKAQYRRYDDGKKSLLGSFTDRWSDDSEAFFTERGAFKSEYIGAKMRAKFPDNRGIGLTAKSDYSSFADQFDESENTWWQRRIPKRFSNADGASVTFTIPKGYTKFDFLYHAHRKGDKVTVTVSRGAGKVKIAHSPNAWGYASDAHNYVADLSLAPVQSPDGGNDRFGVPNMRLHFLIDDASSETAVTITKSSDTSKYLIYWGVSFWGTEQLPFACHLDVMAIGGYTLADVYNLRGSMIKAVKPTSVLLEICLNDLMSVPFRARMATVAQNIEQLRAYIQRLAVPYAVWIPHKSGNSVRDHGDEVDCNYRMTEYLLKEKEISCVGSAARLFDSLVAVYYQDTSLADFMISKGDGIHLYDEGQKVYRAFWKSIF